MARLGKFDEMKVKLAMKARNLTRKEAVKVLGLRAEKKAVRTHPEGATDRVTSAKKFLGKIGDEMELMSAEDFFKS